MKIQDGKLEKQDSLSNPFAIQLDEPMQTIAAPGVCEMKPYLGEDSRGYSTQPGG
ncbi:hypothetical protein NG831_13990 [Xanthomonas sacchari]|uniref:Uncharacterized protein n=1 Tax=Xanthomonas sontii TaxID=2650745 RepID=A0A6N7QAR6_9XANT|nr:MULTISPECIES: hypothetical protein [Xanthomonas]MDV0437250.1 hypothetical protein [Xanthomonas sacchari]MRH01439.1 hypothetical protein [Xanthomonas sontii]MRH75787.1 hypothetical protein [Xanthomonas sontii]UYK65328.1 hypothetical protein NG831_13990 [Xanthomonas sacchari]UYK71309.1 hypothetical protein NG828_13790 [Xanthomonas sacchari]